VAAIGDAAGIELYGGTMLEGAIGTIASAHAFATFRELQWGTELFGPLLLTEKSWPRPCNTRTSSWPSRKAPAWASCSMRSVCNTSGATASKARHDSSEAGRPGRIKQETLSPIYKSKRRLNMADKIFQHPRSADFLRLASGLDTEGGSPRTKQIVHRILSDLFKTIEDLEIVRRIWRGVHQPPGRVQRGRPALAGPGPGPFLDMRMDAEDAVGITGGTPRTIEGPLYVAGAPVEQGFARLDDGGDQAGQTIIMQASRLRRR
jgi:hypothetical protein